MKRARTTASGSSTAAAAAAAAALHIEQPPLKDATTTANAEYDSKCVTNAEGARAASVASQPKPASAIPSGSKRSKASAAQAWKPEGEWCLVEAMQTQKKIGRLDFRSNCCTLKNAGDIFDLSQKATKAANNFVFKGECESWRNCFADFKVVIAFRYDPVADSIEGDAQVNPKREPDYGPDCAFGGGYSFKGSRVKRAP
jgi:hypothetical protein